MDKNNQNKVPNDCTIKLILRAADDSLGRRILTIGADQLGGEYIVDSIIERGHKTASFLDTEQIPADREFRNEFYDGLEVVLKASIVNAEQRNALSQLIMSKFTDIVRRRQNAAREIEKQDKTKEWKKVETELGENQY